MRTPLSNITGREKRGHSPNTAASKEETLKSDPTSENSSTRENPLESKTEPPKGTQTSVGGEAEEANANGDTTGIRRLT
jgi:hypothetical protein